jgi:RNAse (barnase) inhibitor barstar
MENTISIDFLDIPSMPQYRGLVAIIPMGIDSKEGLFDILSEKLMFPSYFGKNWNALYDCLRDFHWISDGKEVYIVHEDIPCIDHQDFIEYLNILNECVVSWKNDAAHKIHIIFNKKYEEIITAALNGASGSHIQSLTR